MHGDVMRDNCVTILFATALNAPRKTDNPLSKSAMYNEAMRDKCTNGIAGYTKS